VPLPFYRFGRIIRLFSQRTYNEKYSKEVPYEKINKPDNPGQQTPDPHADTADRESAVLAMIAAMPEPDRIIGERLHEIIRASAPVLSPKLWYGMPAYAKDGKVVCFFQGMDKFKTRYATFGFMHEANLDEGNMWPTAFALKKVTAAKRGKDRSAREESGELRTKPPHR